MNMVKNCVLVIVTTTIWIFGHAQQTKHVVHKLQNPITTEYLTKNLASETPRLILTPSKRDLIKQKVQSDKVVQNYLETLELNAAQIMRKPLLTREKIGRRLLGVSREMLYRMGVLGMVYSIDPTAAILQRIDEELLAVCGFSDWNPSHYLDVAEMSLALALAVDWVGEELSENTVRLVKENLIVKGIKPSYNPDGNVGWIDNNNNWNQVCHAGMIAASVVIAEDEPELAARTISRALEGIPFALEEYGPDGVYPEGSTYWGYGTAFSVMTSSMLTSAFGTDFGLADYPAFLESADFRLLANTPSGMYYNYADCGDRRSPNADVILAWFANHTGNSNYFEQERLLIRPEEIGEVSRIHGPALVWIASYEPGESRALPTSWQGRGSNPIVVFHGGAEDPHQYYLGAKGGRGTVNHGNMDGGSFIFELNGVRWVIDPGNQRYHDLEKTGFRLWDRCQDCERWKLLTKNNYGHSTLTVNNALHVVDGMATISNFSEGEEPEATFDFGAAFGENLKKAHRTFRKEGPQSLLIKDQITPSDLTEMVTWQLMTTAEVEFVEGGALLRQAGQTLRLEQISHPNLQLSVISLDPPPFKLDRQIDGLKRLELRVPAYMLQPGENSIEVKLSGDM